MTATEHDALASDASFRCSPWTRAQSVDPIGSTPRFDALILAEWPLPWPADVDEIPALAEASTTPGLRVMLVVPRHDDGATGLSRVVHHRRVGTNRFVGADHQAPHPEVPALVAALAADAVTDSTTLASFVGDALPEVLVCAHGRRDACCGRWGTLLHVELAAQASDVRVWRCSHTGGHRFAPTAITLPEGRAWAYVDSDILGGIVHRSVEPSALTDHDRGTSSLDPWAQVVERAVFTELGWDWFDCGSVAVTTSVDTHGQRAEVTLRWEGGSASGEVVITRTLPILVCGEPPEHATKTSPEYALTHFQMG